VKRILVTGFGPFGSYKVNPTEDLVRRFTGRFVIETHVFPTSYDSVRDELPELLVRTKPDAVIAFGLAPRATAIRLEGAARNKGTGRSVDVNGKVWTGLIDERAQESLPSTLPLKSIAQALRNLDIAYEFSNNAGGYVCNYLFFLLQQDARKQGIKVSGLIHVPDPTLYRLRHGADLDLTSFIEVVYDEVVKLKPPSR
jgi:pyroglutamyl-peptidase